MGLFDRLRGRGAGDEVSADPGATLEHAADGDQQDVTPLEEIGVRRLSPDDEATLQTARAGYAEHGIDPEDLETVVAAYQEALDRHDETSDSSAVVTMVATAIGDHLVATAGYRWVVSTDPFGTDLAVEPPRDGIPVVTRTLVAVRWMGRERNWIPGVTAHLARAGRG